MEILKNIKKNTIILLIITAIVLVFVLKDDIDSIVNALKIMDYKYVLLAIVFFFFYIIIKGFINYKTINDKEKISLKEAIKHNMIAQFFNGITPFSTGGQPMEVYMITEHDIPVAKATNITIQCFIFYQTALVIYGILAVGYNSIFHIFPKVPVLKYLVLLGFIINTLVAVLLFLISKSKKTTKKIVGSIINFLIKIKIIKDKNYIEKVNNTIEEFSEGAKELQQRKKLFYASVFLNLISLTLLYSIPILLMFGLHDYTSMNLADTITASAYVLIVGSFVPIPGASGGIEYSFLQFFGNFLNKNIISTILIVWRFITYYLGIIIGAILFNIEKKVK